MIEYKIILTVKSSNGEIVKVYVPCYDRETGMEKLKYLSQLAIHNPRDLQEWANENLEDPGKIVGTDGLFAITSIKIL
jgi:hypothetical protein